MHGLLSIEDCIVEALELIGGEGSTASEARSARRSIALLLEEWAARRYNTWRVERLPLIAGISSQHVLPGEVDDVLDVTVIGPGGASESGLERIDRGAYATISTKGQTSRPSLYYLERSEPPRLFLYPIGDIETQVIVWYVTRPSGVDQVPSRWVVALVSGLAWHLAQKRAELDEAVIERLERRYREMLDVCVANDRERTSFRVSIGGRR